jgi:hypothetical protein
LYPSAMIVIPQEARAEQQQVEAYDERKVGHCFSNSLAPDMELKVCQLRI